MPITPAFLATTLLAATPAASNTTLSEQNLIVQEKSLEPNTFITLNYLPLEHLFIDIEKPTPIGISQPITYQPPTFELNINDYTSGATLNISNSFSATLQNHSTQTLTHLSYSYESIDTELISISETSLTDSITLSAGETSSLGDLFETPLNSIYDLRIVNGVVVYATNDVSKVPEPTTMLTLLSLTTLPLLKRKNKA